MRFVYLNPFFKVSGNVLKKYGSPGSWILDEENTSLGLNFDISLLGPASCSLYLFHFDNENVISKVPNHLAILSSSTSCCSCLNIVDSILLELLTYLNTFLPETIHVRAVSHSNTTHLTYCEIMLNNRLGFKQHALIKKFLKAEKMLADLFLCKLVFPLFIRDLVYHSMM